jgi:hypothetical protein
VISCRDHGPYQGDPEQHLAHERLDPDQTDAKDVPEYDLEEGQKDHTHKNQHEDAIFNLRKDLEWILGFVALPHRSCSF